MAVVKVPRTPKRAFNKDRPPSALLLDQIKHLEWAALPASQRKPKDLKKYRQVKTEAQAAERIAQLTTLIQQHAHVEPDPAAPKTGVQAKVVLPPLPRLRRGTKTSRVTTRRKVRARRIRRKQSRGTQ
jgi:hypothetical protein